MYKDSGAGTDPGIVRCFWHGRPLNQFQLACLRSFADRGYPVELFTYDRGLAVPGWIARRDAGEIWPADRVLRYQSGPEVGNPSLHSNLFRYALLHLKGGWWFDLDVILLRSDLPTEEYYFAEEEESVVCSAVLKFPVGHPLLAEAVDLCVAVGESAAWGQTGPKLITRLIEKHGLNRWRQPPKTTFPVHWSEVQALFDPKRSKDLQERCAGSHFIHLFNEIWRRCGIPTYLGPPPGSFLDTLFARHNFGIEFPARMEFADLERWTNHYMKYSTLQGDIEGLKSYNAALNDRLRALQDERQASRSWRDFFSR